MATLDEDAVDEILYLARANEPVELASYLSELSAQTKRPSAELVGAAVDPFSKNSALHYAAANGHTDVIKLLFSTSAGKPAAEFINAVNEAGNTALHWAALNGHLESVKFLVQSGADVTIINQAGHDAVFEAEINDKKDVVDWLLGAVEELESGIGQVGEASPEDEDMDDEDGAAVRGSTATVEDARKQMEDMTTGNSASQDG
ncbi:ankyrin repeat-containing domain protein [Paraphoma chrysanthemicola]|uniref:Ankyrin repeat-containing domain protein n=1 Tax=Paraphoma chrysanthemicola TaxID=798071 RepID=A0A8K0VV28_9PLEO|nr:ankyrin repeat-containing domain protein [Paraphoma chrysanthemicola]